MTASLNPAAPHHLPAFIAAPGETDVMMVVVGVFLVVAVMMVGTLFLRLHTLPERIAHKSHKLQFEIVAVLGVLALFTHVHLFWVAGLLLALIDIPDFGSPLRRMAGSLEKIAGITAEVPEEAVASVARSEAAAADVPDETVAASTRREGAADVPDKTRARSSHREQIHA